MKAFGFRAAFVGICVGFSISLFVSSESWPAPAVEWALAAGGVALGLASICVLAWTRPTRWMASSGRGDGLRSMFAQVGITATVAANTGILGHRTGQSAQIWVALSLLIGAFALAAVLAFQLRRTAPSDDSSISRKGPLAASSHTTS